jgi:hypothetical protein
MQMLESDYWFALGKIAGIWPRQLAVPEFLRFRVAENRPDDVFLGCYAGRRSEALAGTALETV